MGSATLRFGLLPDEGGQYLLVQMMGVAKAMDFLMRKRIVSAQEALGLGLVHEVVAPTELMPLEDAGVGARVGEWAAGRHAHAEAVDLQCGGADVRPVP